MLALTYIEHGKFALLDKPEPEILDPRDAVVRVTLGSICTSDLHIKHGSVPRAVPGITVGHEMVGVVESVGSSVTTVKPGDRVTVNVGVMETGFGLDIDLAGFEDPEGILPTLKAGQFILVTGELQARKRDYFCIGAVEEIRRQENRPEVRL